MIISRYQLRQAVEAGITAATKWLPVDAPAKLRNVAETTKRVRVGSFGYGTHCACPAVQAGLFRDPEFYPDGSVRDDGYVADGVSTFAVVFDARIYALASAYSGVYEVVG
jgi:hypothetical protein